MSDECSAESSYDGHLGARISSIFVIGVISTMGTLLPLWARHSRTRFRGIEWVYMVCRYFGTGVIGATAFIHLLAPAYDEYDIVAECLGGGWLLYDWVPCLLLVSSIGTFLIDVSAAHYVSLKYGIALSHTGVTGGTGDVHNAQEEMERSASRRVVDEQAMAQGDAKDTESADSESVRKLGVKQQIAGYMILEFGVLFHSVIIGLNLGSTGDEFASLYIVLVFHQTFEGLGLGSRLSTIPFNSGSPWPWLLGLAYGLTTPIAIAIGIGVRYTYSSDHVSAAAVSCVLDALSSGILIYTFFTEMLGHDFIYNPMRERNTLRLYTHIFFVLLGAGLMALLGKWA